MIENRSTSFDTDTATAVAPARWEPPQAPLEMPRQVLEEERPATRLNPLAKLFFPQRA